MSRVTKVLHFISGTENVILFPCCFQRPQVLYWGMSSAARRRDTPGVRSADFHGETIQETKLLV